MGLLILVAATYLMVGVGFGVKVLMDFRREQHPFDMTWIPTLLMAVFMWPIVVIAEIFY